MSRQSSNAADPDGMDPLDGQRKAALLLHAMPAESRLWLLAQLPADESKPLQDLLAELEELGIPADGAMLREILSDADGQTGMAEQVRAVQTQRAIVERAGPGLLHLVLRDEPAGRIARVLALFDWRWEEAFLDQLAAPKRLQVAVLLARYRAEGRNRPAGPDLLREHILAKLSAKVSGSHMRWVLDQTLPFPRPVRSRRWWWRSRPAAGLATAAPATPTDRTER